MSGWAPDTVTAGRIGFVGLGEMGLPMVENLAKAGLKPTVYDIRSEPLDAAAAAGAVPAGSLDEVARNSDIVFVCVLDSAQLTEVVTGPDGLLETWKLREAGLPVPLVVAHSTVTPATIRGLASAAAAAAAGVLDATVSGGKALAVSGELTILVGGAADDLARCQPFFDVMAAHVVHVSDQPGAGAAAKLCNNVMALCNGFATLEAAKLGRAYGIDEDRLVAIASVSTGDSWFVRHWDFLDGILATHASPEDTLTKDLSSAIKAAADCSVSLPFVMSTLEVAATLLAERRELLANRTGGESAATP